MKSEQMVKLDLKGGRVDGKGFFRARPCCGEGDLFFSFFSFSFFLNHFFHFEVIFSFPCYFEVGRKFGGPVDFGGLDLFRGEVQHLG